MKKKKILCSLFPVLFALVFVPPAIAADLYLNTPLASAYYQSNDRIIAQSNCRVPTGNWAWFVAGAGVTLQPGFRVESGAEFGVVIGGYGDVPPDLDYDNDGLPDWWELIYFAGLGQTGIDDYDSDGIPNDIEYEKGTDPTDPYSGPQGVYYEYDALGRIKEIIRLPSQ